MFDGSAEWPILGRNISEMRTPEEDPTEFALLYCLVRLDYVL